MSPDGRGGESQRVNPLRLVASAVSMLVGATCAVVLVATMLGRTAVLSVPSPSMTPTIPVGAAIAAAPVAADDVRIGDVIVFQAPGSEHLTVHRVVQIDRDGDGRTFRTRGDANDHRDPWRLALDGDTVHRVDHVVPHVGRALAVLHGREVRLGLLSLGALLFVAVGLRAIWAPALRAGSTLRSARSRRRARVIAAAVAAAAVAATSAGEAQAQLSTATGSVLPVSSAALGTPASFGCAWTSTTQLTFVWNPDLSGAPAGTRLSRSSSAGGTYSTVADVAPATTTSVTVSALAPVTTNRFHRLATYRGGSWTGPPTDAIGSADCRGAIGAFAGSGTSGFLGDGGAASSARLNAPRGLAFAPDGSLYIADTANSRIRRVAPDGTISTFAGGAAPSPCSYTGPVAGLGLDQPFDVAVDGVGDVIIADTRSNCVRRVDTAGNVTSVAGGGSTTACNSSGAAGAVRLSSPRGVAVDAAGAVYIADSSRSCVRKVLGGTYSHVLGGGSTSACTASGPATAASLSVPNDVEVDTSGTVYVADRGRNCVRKVVGTTFSHVLGGGGTTSCASSGPTSSVALSAPEGLAIDASGRLLVAEAGRRCVRAVDGSTYGQVAFTGSNSGTGDGGPGVAATMRRPSGIAVDAGGQVVVSDRSTSAASSVVRSIVGPWPL